MLSARDHGLERMNQLKPHQGPIFSRKKVMLSVWWYFKGIVYFELLPDNTTINSEVYCNQLDKLSDALKEKRPELVNRKGVG